MSKPPEVLALERAKIQWMRKPNTLFYTTVLFSLRQEWDITLPTAATNGVKLFINPEYLMQLTEGQRITLLAHEVLHVALQHMLRLGDRHHQTANKAMDYVINLMLKDARYDEIPHWLCDSRFYDMSYEQVYDILYKEAEKSPGGLDGVKVPGGSDVIKPSNAAEADAVKQDVADIIQKAKMQSESAGQSPGMGASEIGIQLDATVNPKIPWEVLLQNYFSSFQKNDYTWSRPNSRYMPEFYMPTMYGEVLGDIATAVDASGSVSPYEFSHFIGEHGVIQERLKPSKMTVITFDTEISEIQEITQDTDILKELEFHGGGGTDITPVFLWAQKNNPEVLIIFTDGEFYTPVDSTFPSCPILWLIHGNTYFEFPIGEIIYYDIDK